MQPEAIDTLQKSGFSLQKLLRSSGAISDWTLRHCGAILCTIRFGAKCELEQMPHVCRTRLLNDIEFGGFVGESDMQNLKRSKRETG